MSNFKAGDRVRRVSPVLYITKRATGIQKDGIYTVDESYGKAVTLRESYLRTFTFNTSAFELEAAMGGDDEFPPAPESVRYNEEDSAVGTFGHLLVQPSIEGPLLYIAVFAEQYSTGKCASTGIRIEPDAALQLCHDLRRMAMSIKRKEKQNA